MSILPHPDAGGLVIRDLAGNPVNPPNVLNAYVPAPAWVSNCSLTALPSDCTAKIEARQINSIVSEIVSFSECLDPDGPWDCVSMKNLCNAFNGWYVRVRGQPNGLASLDSSGHIPLAQIPDQGVTDEVREYSSLSAFPPTGESGVIYIATDTNRLYRWGGSSYIQITANSDPAKVNKAGDTMTGFLTLNADPVNPLQAATRQFVLATLSTATAGTVLEAPNDAFVYGRKQLGWTQVVNRIGDTMGGFLTLNADPTANLHAATKQYVDTKVASVTASDRVAKAGDTMTGPLTMQGMVPATLAFVVKDSAGTATMASIAANGNISTAGVYSGGPTNTITATVAVPDPQFIMMRKSGSSPAQAGMIYCSETNGRLQFQIRGGANQPSMDSNGNFYCWAINCTTITTNNSNINAGTGVIQAGPIVCTTINTQNNNISMGSGTLTCGPATINGAFTCSGTASMNAIGCTSLASSGNIQGANFYSGNGIFPSTDGGTNQVIGSQSQRWYSVNTILLYMANTDTPAIYFSKPGVGSYFRIMGLYSTSPPRIVIDNVADVGVYLAHGTQAWGAWSDVKNKRNIANYSVLDRLAAFRCVTYDLLPGTKGEDAIDSPPRRHIGAIAQECNEAFPEVVDTDVADKWGIRYAELAPIALQGVKELLALVDRLTTRVQELEARLDAR